MTNTRELAEKLLKGCEGVTEGAWVAGSEKSEGSYGSGEDNYEGYHTSQLLDAKGLKIADALNSDVGMVNEDFDDEGWCYAWDEQAEKNFAHIANCDPTSIRALATAYLELLDEREATEAQVKTLQEALGPFASVNYYANTFNHSDLSDEDFRRARTALGEQP